MLTDYMKNVIERGHLATIINAKCLDSDNKIESLIYIIISRSNELFNRLFEKGLFTIDDIILAIKENYTIIPKLSNVILDNEYFISEIVKIVEPEWYDFLPSHIAKMPEVQEKCDRKGRERQLYIRQGVADRDGFHRDWTNNFGEFLTFFTLKGNFPIKSKKDYLIIYKRYLESNLSMVAFCKKYGITPVSGFAKFLERLELESKDFFDDIKDVKQNASDRFLNATIENSRKIVSGEMSFDEFINNPKINFNESKIDLLFRVLSAEQQNKLARIIMDYLEAHAQLLPSNFILFLTVRNLKPVDSYNTFVRRNLSMPNDKEYIYKYKKQISSLIGHSKPYYRNKLYLTYIIDGKKYTINDEIIDQAYAYATNNNYHISDSSMTYLTKQIAMGLLNYSNETKVQKEEMVDTIIELIKEEATILDYLNHMEETSTIK